jgi:ribonuclease-3
MEFLGDALLGFVIADLLFREFPGFDEGQKSKTKASLVSTTTLARQAERLRLGDHLLLGRWEEKTGGRRKQALLADGYEALIAAIYLDGGIEHARAFIVREFAPWLDEVRRDGVSAQDYKSALQELLQSREMPLPNTASRALSGPITGSCSRSTSSCAASGWRREPGRARKKRSRTPRARRSTS